MCALIRGGELAQLLPFGDAEGGGVALGAQVPQARVVGGLVQGGGEEALGGLGLIDGAVSADLGTAGLWLSRRIRGDRLRRGLGVLEALPVLSALPLVARRQHLGMDGTAALGGLVAAGTGVVRIHAVAPLRMRAMWMNLSGTPTRSAQPFWCIRQEESAETTYSAPAWA